MKIKYYVKNDKGEKILVRTSENEYNFALVNISGINDGNKMIYCCSKTYENIVKQYNHIKNTYERNMIYCKTHNNIDDANMYKNEIENLKIVELITE